MSGSSHQPERHRRVATLALVAAYSVLGAALLWSRLYSLGHSFWTDEILMISAYVREGPGEILVGAELSHKLLALSTWATRAAIGESEVAFRLWSAVPFVAGVVVVTAWLHKRVSALSGVLFLFLCLVAPLLLDITRQARGYGLAFLAMGIIVVGALDAHRTGRTWAVIAMCASGVLGAWTLPQVGIAFVSTGAAASVDPRIRRRMLIGLAVSTMAICIWYLPHVGAVRASSQVSDGIQLTVPWVAVAPLDQILLPALIWIDGTVIVPALVWLPLSLIAVIVAAASPLLREGVSAAILGSGVVATVLVLWIGDAHVIPRYLSYLLVPLFVVLATGAASILGGITIRRSPLRTLVCVVLLLVLALRFGTIAPDVVALPREANRDAAEVIMERDASTRVLAYMRNPQNLAFYLGRSVEDRRGTDIAASVCNSTTPIYYVAQPFGLDDVRVPCLGTRPGVEFHHFAQYARGNEMNVWFVPVED